MTSIKRLNYNYGQFLTATDFQAEQDYHKGLRRIHNQSLHTPGVASGLDPAGAAGATKITVAPGIAIDGQGRELVLNDAASLDLVPFAGKQYLLLTVAYNEFDDPADTLPADKVPAASGPISTRKTEVPKLTLTPVTLDARFPDGLPPADNLAIRLGLVSLNTPDFKTVKELVLNCRQTAGSKTAAITSLPKLDVVGDVNVGGKIGVTGAATVGGALQVTGNSVFTGDVQVNGKLNLPVPLGIGLTGAAATLTVNANIGGLGPGVPGIMIGNPNGTTALWQGKDASNYVQFAWLDPNYARIQVGGNKPLALQESGGNVGIGTTAPTARLHVAGTLKVDGAKTGYVADQFVNQTGEALEMGDVVVIGDAPPVFHYGVRDTIPTPEVDFAAGAYDTRVCGIVCEVHGEMHAEAAPAKAKKTAAKPAAGKKAAKKAVAIAESSARIFSEGELAGRDIGRVESGQIGLMVTLGAYAHCKVDADIAAIKAGDLLTTSPTPGHAQKVLDRSQAIGAIIGKALAPLKKGKGMIPVMVMLQ